MMRPAISARVHLGPAEVTHAVPVFAVPLGPHNGELAHLVAAFAHVPRLGDQLDFGQRGVLVDGVEERAEAADVVELAGKRGCQVETEAVHVHLRAPVPQRIHDHLQHLGIAHV